MRARAIRWLATLGLAAVASVTPALAQSTAPDAGTGQAPPQRAWLGLGGGYMSFRSDCGNCEHTDKYTSGGGIVINGGIALNGRFDGGAEVTTTFSSNDVYHYRTSYVLAVGRFRPWSTKGFYLKGGFGLAFFRGGLTGAGSESADVTTRGLGVHYGVGWVFGQGRRVSLAPFGAQYVATLGDIDMPTFVATNAVSNAWLAGVLVMFR